MPMIRFSCPRCVAVLECDDSHAGGKVACLKCRQRLRVPTPALPPLDKTATAPLVAEPAKNARLLTWLEILSPSVPPNLTLNPSEPVSTPTSAEPTEKVPYVYECVAWAVGFLLGMVLCLLVTPTMGAFFAGLLLGLAAFALALYVGQNESKWRDWKWWCVVAVAAFALLSGTLKLLVEGILAGNGTQRMFLAGFLGVLVGYPVGVVFLRFRPVRLGPETLRTYAAVLVTAAVGVNSSFIFFTPHLGPRPPSTSQSIDDRFLQFRVAGKLPPAPVNRQVREDN
jgi:hypothetical protein